MKERYWFLSTGMLFLILTFSVFGQTSEIRSTICPEAENNAPENKSHVIQFNSGNSLYKPISIISDNDKKTTFAYTLDGKIVNKCFRQLTMTGWEIVEELKYTYNPSGILIVKDSLSYDRYTGNVFFRNEYNYDVKGNLISDLEYHKYSDQWEKAVLTEYAYDDNDNKIEIIRKENVNNQWVIRRKQINTFDDRKNLLTSTNQALNGGTLSNIVRYTYAYDSNNKMVSDLREEWKNGVWSEVAKKLYLFDGNGKIVEYEYLSGSGTLYPIERIRYSYAGDNLTEVVTERYSNNNWVFSDIKKYFYLAGNRYLRIENEVYSSGLMVLLTKYFYNYNNQNILTSRLKEEWITGTGVKARVDSFYYDNSGRLIENNYGVWEAGVYKSKVKKGYGYNNRNEIVSASAYEKVGNKWRAYGSEFTFVSHTNDTLVVSGSQIDLIYSFITEVENNNSMVESFKMEQNYPNPFNPNTTIKYSLPNPGMVSIKLYNSLGQEVSTLLNEEKDAGSYELQLNLSGFSSGVYLYKMESSGITQTRKMVLLK